MAKLNYNHLYYFWVIAKEGHLGRAAAKLFVSQSALSTQLKKLENQLSNPLFSREGRLLQLTEAGQLTLSYADKIFGLGNELSGILKNSTSSSRMVLKIGIVSSLSRNFVENFIRPVLNRDDVELMIESGNQDELLIRLGQHQLHIVLSNFRPSPSAQYAFKTKSVAKQQLSLIGKPLANAKPFNFPQDLSQHKLLLPSVGTEIRAMFDLICYEQQITYTNMAEINDMPTLRLILRDSNCVALMPKVVVQDEVSNHTLQEYCTIPGLYEQFYAISTKRHFEPEIIKMLLGRDEAEVLSNVSESKMD